MTRLPGLFSRTFGWLTFARLVAAIVFIAIFTMAVRVPTDSDTWWHLRSGQWIVEHRSIPRVDPFSHTRHGEPWVDHSWLAQIVLFGLYTAAGYAGLALLVAALVTVAFIFVRLQCQVRVRADLWLCAFTLIIAAATSGVIWVARPQMFSFVFTAATAYLLHRFKSGDLKAIWWLPPLMLVWVNTHGGFAVGFILIVAHAFGEFGNWVLGNRGTGELKDQGVGEPGDWSVEVPEGRGNQWRRIGRLALVFLV